MASATGSSEKGTSVLITVYGSHLFHMTTRTETIYALAILFAINALNFFDRQVFGAIAEPVRKEWGLSDSAIGLVGTAFTLVYAAVGLPLGRLTDKSSTCSGSIGSILRNFTKPQ